MLVKKSWVTDHRSKRWDRFVFEGKNFSARERHWTGIFFLGFIPVWIEVTKTLYHSRG